MEKVILFILITILFLPAFVLTQYVESEKEAVKKVIIDGYISGVFLKGDPKMVKKNWHEACDMLDFQDGKMKKIPAALWVDHFEKKPGPYNENITYEFTDIQISGYAAIATVEIYNIDKSKHIYTDYMCLYKFDDGWKRATKTFYAYPHE